MPEVATKMKTYRFDQMAVQVKCKVEPAEADVDRYVGLEHIDPESLKIRRWGVPSDVESSKIVFRSGDVIFGKRRAYQRKLAVADFDGICSAHAMVLRPKTDVVLKDFLPFFMQTDAFMERAVKVSVGGLSPTINWDDLAKEEFALPPIEEQHRMVAALKAFQSFDDACAGLCNAIEQSISAIREHVFGIQANSVPLADLCSGGKGIQIGPFGAQLHKSDYTAAGIPVVMPTELVDDRICDDSIARVPESKANSLKRHRLDACDIVLPRRGDFDRRALVGRREEGWLCGTGCLRIRLDDPNLAPFVTQSLASQSVLRWLDSRSVGTVMPNLNLQIVGAIPVRIPPKRLADESSRTLSELRERWCDLRSRMALASGQRRMIIGGIE